MITTKHVTGSWSAVCDRVGLLQEVLMLYYILHLLPVINIGLNRKTTVLSPNDVRLMVTNDMRRMVIKVMLRLVWKPQKENLREKDWKGR